MADDWGRSIDDPFGSAAVEILNSLTPSPPKLPPPPPSPSTSNDPSDLLSLSHSLHSSASTVVDADPFLTRLDAAAQLSCSPSPSSLSASLTSSSSSSSASSTGRTVVRPTIYEEDDEVRSSQEESASTPTSTPHLRLLPPLPHSASVARFSSFPFRPLSFSSSSSFPSPPIPSRTPAASTQSSSRPSQLTTPVKHSAHTPIASSTLKPPAERRVRDDKGERGAPGWEEEEKRAFDPADPYAGVGEMPGGGADMNLGFTSGSGKRVTISAAALVRGQQLMREVEDELTRSRPLQDDPDAPLQSIKSAGKSRFQPPLTAAKPRSTTTVPLAPPPSSFKTPARISRPPAASSAPRQPPAPYSLDESSSLAAGGFTTGRGVMLPPASEASLAKARALMASVAAEIDAPASQEHKDERKLAETGPMDGMEEEARGGGERKREEMPEFVGFSTGRGQKVTISEDSWRKSRLLFQELEQEEMQRPASAAGAEDEDEGSWLPPNGPRKTQTASPATRPPPSLFKPPARQPPRTTKPAALPFLDAPLDAKPSAAVVSDAAVEDLCTFSSSSPPFSTPPFTPPDGAPPSDAMGMFVTGREGVVNLRPESWARAQRLMDTVEREEGTENEEEALSTQPQLLAPRRPLAPLSANSPHQRPPASDDAPLQFKPPRGKENSTIPPHLQPDKAALLPAPRPVFFSVPKPAPRPVRPPMTTSRPLPTDSPLPSPGPALSSSRAADRRPQVEEEDTSNKKKKRRLAFNTPRPHVTGKTVGRGGSARDAAEEPNLLRSASRAAAVQSEMNKRAPLSAPLPPLPSLEPPSSLLSFSCTQHPIERCSESELFRLGLSDEVIHMTATSALGYRFTIPSSTGADYTLGAEQVYHHLIQQGCDPSLFSPLWVRNHFRWIVWKLAALERSFPSHLAGKCLTYYQLMKQMKRRYHKELEQVQRSSLALILERDESPARYLVLCIASILPSPDAGAEGDEDTDSADPDNAILLHTAFRSSCHLVLTDGHYSIPAKLDPPLLALLHRRRLHVGSTLRIFNASLGGGTEAVTPLENDSVHLELHANSTRRAPRGYKLGLQRTGTFSVSLKGVMEGGGALPCVYAVVGRVYPMVFLEMQDDGSKMHRSQRAEDQAQEVWKEQVEKKMEEQRLQWEARVNRDPSRSQLNSSSFAPLSSSLDSSSMYREEDAMEMEPPQPRKVIPYIKVRLHELVPAGAAPPLPALEREDGGVVDEEAKEKVEERAVSAGLLSGCECVLTLWRPMEVELEMLAEGTAVAIYGALVSGRFDGFLRLSTARSTPIIRIPSIHPFPSLQPRAVPFNQLQALLSGAEFDAVMMVVYESRHSSSASSTTTRQLYGAYDSDDLLMVDVTESSQLVLLPANPLQLPLVALLTAVKYSHYDQARRVHVAHATKESAVRLRVGGEAGGASRRALMTAWVECKEWFDTQSGEQVRQMQRERVRCLVEEVDGSSDVESEAWYTRLGSSIQATEAERAQKAMQPKDSKPKTKQRLLQRSSH